MPRIIVVLLLSFSAMCTGFPLRRDEVLPGIWKDTRVKRNSNAVFVQRPFTAKITYVNINAYMDTQTIHLSDDLLLLMLKELHLEVKE